METVLRSVPYTVKGRLDKSLQNISYYRSSTQCTYAGTSGCAITIDPSIGYSSYELSVRIELQLYCYDSGGTCPGNVYVNIGGYSSNVEIPSDTICNSYGDSQRFYGTIAEELTFTRSDLISGKNIDYEFKSFDCNESGTIKIYGIYTASGRFTFKTLSLLKKNEVFTFEIAELPIFENGALIEVEEITLSSSDSKIVRVSDNKAYPVANGNTTLRYVVTYRIYYPDKPEVSRDGAYVNKYPVTVHLQDSQTITYKGPHDFIVDKVLVLSASSTSGLKNFIYSCSQQGAHITDNKIVFTSPGIYTIDVTQPGNSDYDPATISVSVVCGIDNLSPSLSLIS